MPQNKKNQGGCHTKKIKKKWGIFQPSFSKAKCKLLRTGQPGALRISPPGKKVEEPLIFCHRVTMQARSGELWWSTLADDSYSSVPTACDILAEDAFSIASQHSATFVDFRTEIGRSVTFYFWTLQRSGELWWSTLSDDSYSSNLKACDIIAEDAFSIASQHSATFVDFRTEIGRSVTFCFWTL